MKRTFRQVAVIAGLIERRHPGREKTGRQVTHVDRSHLRRAAPARSRATFCWRRPGPMRPQACWTSRGSAIFCAASRAESGINRSTACRRCRCRSCWRSARSRSAGCAREELLREARRAHLMHATTIEEHRMLELKPERLAFDDFQDQPISICGKLFRADMSGALYWPGEDALIVADLHLEKGSALRRARPAAAALRHARDAARLAAVIDRYDAGDRHRARRQPARCGRRRAHRPARSCEILQILQEDREWIWVTGNHDPEIGERLGGSVVGDIEVDGITLRHEPRPGARHARDRRPLASGRAAVAARLLDPPALLRRQRPPPRDAGVRHLRRRPQHARRAVRAAVRQRRHARCGCSARKASTPSRRASSRRTDASQPGFAAEERRCQQPRQRRRA